ncbi:DUF2935 domain-containing protein [Clostridium cylindrosporum]|uniref:DUF2935 domain-containing protein n=1 Tax=Clostridium cylindrosporum DSM 605 TaxID=1121307 RepID=A0A0J8D9P6_CLOCY|nr:DUF2935 domain-containing protein [Clostridium cylindrosporum]KMT21034.1 hypothetical protein CLCY_1c02680 [Clostridium cylindrosporum DSM 605]
MITKQKFIIQSLELNLFFLRIMKEHSIFLEAAFVCKDKNLIAQADAFKNEFTKLLSSAINLSDGVIPSRVLQGNEIVTKYTLEAEKATQFVSGVSIDSSITSRELSLSSNNSNKNICTLTDQVYKLNHHSIAATKMIAEFKIKLKNNVLCCNTFTTAYPLLIDHILREAIFFAKLLTRLQNGDEIDIRKDIIEQETFWNRIMSEHSFFIRGFLDPTEVELFDIANNFGKEFEVLRKEASDINKSSFDISTLTEHTLKSTTKLRDFKAQGTEGLLNCKIKSIILPLLGDHVLREANHYLNLLKSYTEV